MLLDLPNHGFDDRFARRVDGRAGIRFNLPGFGRFRPITWDEWFQNFDRHGLTFVYEESPDNAGTPSPRYRIVKTEDWKHQIG